MKIIAAQENEGEEEEDVKNHPFEKKVQLPLNACARTHINAVTSILNGFLFVFCAHNRHKKNNKSLQLMKETNAKR